MSVRKKRLSKIASATVLWGADFKPKGRIPFESKATQKSSGRRLISRSMSGNLYRPVAFMKYLTVPKSVLHLIASRIRANSEYP
jgi:hypothetical protein